MRSPQLHIYIYPHEKEKKDRYSFIQNIWLIPHRKVKSHVVFLFIKLILEKFMFLFELRNIIKISWLPWSIYFLIEEYCKNFEKTVWRFAIVKFNKTAIFFVLSTDRVSLWKFPLWDMWLLGKHDTEMNELSN